MPSKLQESAHYIYLTQVTARKSIYIQANDKKTNKQPPQNPLEQQQQKQNTHIKLDEKN